MDTDNAVWALSNLKPPISNEKAEIYERARLLAFFTHIVGDLHQPLHTTSRISAVLPNGDQGGNLTYVIYKNKRVRLHKIWDEGLGVFDGSASLGSVPALAKKIIAFYPPSYFGEKVSDLNPDHWAKEGLINAKNYVYSTPDNKPVSQVYVQNGRMVSQERAALAGYRLAGLLNQLLGPGINEAY